MRGCLGLVGLVWPGMGELREVPAERCGMGHDGQGGDGHLVGLVGLAAGDGGVVDVGGGLFELVGGMEHALVASLVEVGGHGGRHRATG